MQIPTARRLLQLFKLLLSALSLFAVLHLLGWPGLIVFVALAFLIGFIDEYLNDLARAAEDAAHDHRIRSDHLRRTAAPVPQAPARDGTASAWPASDA